MPHRQAGKRFRKRLTQARRKKYLSFFCYRSVHGSVKSYVSAHVAGRMNFSQKKISLWLPLLLFRVSMPCLCLCLLLLLPQEAGTVRCSSSSTCSRDPPSLLSLSLYVHLTPFDDTHTGGREAKREREREPSSALLLPPFGRDSLPPPPPHWEKEKMHKRKRRLGIFFTQLMSFFLLPPPPLEKRVWNPCPHSKT